MNLHEINKDLKSFSEFYVVIEIPKDTNVKYEVDKKLGVLMVDRFLHTAMIFPFNYGFIPRTLAEDGDPIDVLVLCDQSIYPGSLLKVRPIGVLLMEDEAGKDEKILAVPVTKVDPLGGKYENIDDVPESIKSRIKHFFENYKTLEPGKWVKVKGWLNRDEAMKIIEKYYEKI